MSRLVNGDTLQFSFARAYGLLSDVERSEAQNYPLQQKEKS